MLKDFEKGYVLYLSDNSFKAMQPIELLKGIIYHCVGLDNNNRDRIDIKNEKIKRVLFNAYYIGAVYCKKVNEKSCTAEEKEYTLLDSLEQFILYASLCIDGIFNIKETEMLYVIGVYLNCMRRSYTEDEFKTHIKESYRRINEESDLKGIYLM